MGVCWIPILQTERGYSKTTYTHSAFPTAWEKAEIPPEIKETLGLVKQQYGDFETCLNFAFQLDAPFMLSESASVGAKVLGKLAGSGHDHNRRVHDPEGISPTATAVAGGTHHIKIFDHTKYRVRKLTPTEYGRLQAFPMDNWKQVVSNSQAYKQFGNAVTGKKSQSQKDVDQQIKEATQKVAADTKISLKLDQIGYDVKSIKEDINTTKKEVRELDKKVALLDASIRSAHKRMDSAGIGRADLIEHIEHEKVERNEHHGE